MVKASDNAFPSILITEGTEPSAPAAGKQRLYVDSTSHALMIVNSSGTETAVGGAGGAMATDTLWDTKGDLAAATGSNAGVKVVANAYNGSYLIEDTSVSSGWKSWKRRVIYKAADESIGSSTLQDDDDFVFAIGASESWVMHGYLFITCAASTSDFKYLFTAPTSATIIRYGIAGAATSSTVADAPDIRMQAIDSAVALPVGVVASATIGVQFVVVAGYVLNSTNAGNITLQWAQNSTDAGNPTVLKKGSFLIAERVA